MRNTDIFGTRESLGICSRARVPSALSIRARDPHPEVRECVRLPLVEESSQRDFNPGIPESRHPPQKVRCLTGDSLTFVQCTH